MANSQDNDRDRMQFEGIVDSSCKGKFTVKTDSGHEVICTLSGKIKQNLVRILVGDRVVVEVSPYDTKMGRIVFRMK